MLLLDIQRYRIIITLQKADGTFVFANYENFHVSSETTGYRLHVSGFDGSAGNIILIMRLDDGDDLSCIPRSYRVCSQPMRDDVTL